MNLAFRQGGFNGWVKTGLPVEAGTEYEASPVALIKDEIEILSQKVQTRIRLPSPSQHSHDWCCC